MQLIDKSFVRAPKSYIIQSLLAVATIAIILYFVEFLTHAAVIAALGSSAFVVFAMPRSIIAQPRRLIGGHFVGLISATFCFIVCYRFSCCQKTIERPFKRLILK